MAEIDTRPLESMREAVTLFEPRGGDQLNRFSPGRDTQEEEEVAILTKELATCKLQLQVKENETKQAILRTEALQKAMPELSDKYDRACLDAHGRMLELEAENSAIRLRQSEAADECEALRDELAVVRGELDAAKASVASVLTEVEARAAAERESTKEALMRILQLNETVLSSAVAAIRAEEERSVFFQEVTLGFFDSDRNLEVIRRQTEMMEGMKEELLAKTVEIEFLRSELNQAREKYTMMLSREESGGAAADVLLGGCEDKENMEGQSRQVPVVCETNAVDQEPEAGEFKFQHVPEECFVSEIFRKHCQVVPSDGVFEMSEDAVEVERAVVTTVQHTDVCEGDPDPRVDKISAGEDHRAVQQDNNQKPPEVDGVVLPKDCEMNLLQFQDHEEPKTDVSFALESSRRDDFQSVQSDGVAMPPEHVAGNREPVAEATVASTTCAPREGNNAGTCIVVATTVNATDGEGELVDPEQQGDDSKLGSYDVLVEAGAPKDDNKLLDAVRAEISDLRFSLEEAVRRAELAEEAKAALERELREEIRNKHPSSRRWGSEDAFCRPTTKREGPPPPTPVRARPLNSRQQQPTPRAVTLGKVLNMKYK